MKKETYIPITALVAVFGIFSWITDRIDSKVEKVEIKTEVIKEEVDQEENINIQQSEAIKQIQENQFRFLEEFRELQQAK